MHIQIHSYLEIILCKDVNCMKQKQKETYKWNHCALYEIQISKFENETENNVCKQCVMKLICSQFKVKTKIETQNIYIFEKKTTTEKNEYL